MKFKFRSRLLSGVSLVALIAGGSVTALAAPNHQDAACAGSDYTVQASDWLSKIAEKSLGDVLAYPQIVEATNAAASADDSYATIEDENILEVGWKLCVPGDGAMMADAMMDGEAKDGEAMMDSEGTDGEAMMDGEAKDGEAMMDSEAKDGEAMADDGAMMAKGTTFNVTVENISGNFTHQGSGVFNTPVGADGPGPLLPGNAYEFSFYAAPGERLSMVSMLVQSNDWFVTFSGAGLALFNDAGTPVSGDVTNSLLLYDAGTEIDQTPGEGVDQAPRQAGGNTGEPDPDNTVRRVGDDALPAPLNELVQATLEAGDNGRFTFRLTNISDSSDFATPFAPGVWVVHTEANPIFTAGEADRGAGLEALAEDGNAAALGAGLANISGRATPFAPVAWAVHTGRDIIFSEGAADRGLGLETLAEDGGPATLAESLATVEGVTASGAAAIPVGADGPGPILPGGSYEFSFNAETGALSFALMYVQSNDLFIGPDPTGIDLFNADGTPINGDVTFQLGLWDAGTEVNETPHFGPNQAPRQAGPNTGDDEGGVVRPVDDFAHPDLSKIIRVTVTPAQ